MIEGPKRRGALLDLVLANKEELVGDAKVKGSLGCSDHEVVEFRILRSKVRSTITTLDFRRADFGLFRDLLEKVPWNNGTGEKTVQESWLLFRLKFKSSPYK